MMNCIKALTLACLLVLMSCGDGWLDTGVGVGPLCRDQTGKWQGTASGGGTISLQVTQDECELGGLAVFPPCVPVTPITGEAGLLVDVGEVKTTDGSLSIAPIPNTDPTGPFNGRKRYVFTNTQNRPNCPQSASGTVIFHRTG